MDFSQRLQYQRKLSEAGVMHEQCEDDDAFDESDTFMVGERVWLAGIHAGHIAYLGETNFASGDWVGVVLDRPIGKHSGTVAGHQYFQCEPKHGVFSRLSRLTRRCTHESGGDCSAPRGGSWNQRRQVSSPLRQTSPPANSSTTSQPLSRRSASPSYGKRSSVYAMPAQRRTSLAAAQRGQTATSTKTAADVNSSISTSRSGRTRNLQLGDRVVVKLKSEGKSGTSTAGQVIGTLRFLGLTQFSSDLWAGVELDNGVGKNDGTVAGTRYFECGTGYGVFARVERVSPLMNPEIIRRSPDVSVSFKIQEDDRLY